MKTQNVTLEELAEKLNGNLWVKGDMKRIYLDKGHNTKKMSTKTFVWQDENGNFKVSCRIECPSQSYQWIKSQENEVKELVHSQIDEIVEEITSDHVYVLTNNSGDFIDYFNNIFEAGDPLYENDVYFSIERAEKVIEENELIAEIKTFTKTEWAELCAKFVRSETTGSAPATPQEIHHS